MPEPLREADPAAVGPYRLLGRLGAGGQGVVYLGQAPDGTPVAIKVLHDGADGRLAREIDAARRVEPFCLAQVLDASFEGRPYVVTEYVDGPSLQQAGRHTGAELQRLAVATATALAAIHQAGVVHRDFKPANVLLGPGGPRVIDFGIARAVDASVTASGGIVGTLAYMAPEQLAGAVVGPEADVFAWAGVIVFAATGRPPFGDDSLPAVINRILHNEPQLGDLQRPLREVVLACLAKDPARRPAMRDVLLHLLGGHPAPFSTPSSPSGQSGFLISGDSPAGGGFPAGSASPAGGGFPAGGSIPAGSGSPAGGASPAGGGFPPGGGSLAGSAPMGGSTSGGGYPRGGSFPAGGGFPRSGSFPAGGGLPVVGGLPVGGGEGAVATRPSRRRRRSRALVIAASAGATAVLVTGALVWFTPGTPGTGTLAAVTTPTPSATPGSSEPVSKPTRKPRRTPATPTRSPKRTAKTPDDQDGQETRDTRETASSRPTGRASATRQPSGARPRVAVVEALGGWHIDPGCYGGSQVNIQAKVESSNPPNGVRFSYTWYYDGRPAGSGTAAVVQNYDYQMVHPARPMEAKPGGTRTATLRITSPVSVSKSVTVKFCAEEDPY